jgi:integrase
MNHIEPLIGALRLESVTPDRIDAFYAELAATGRSAHTIRAVHRTLHRALGDAMRSGLVVRNAATAVTPPRVPPSDATERAWEPEQLATFLEGVAGDRLHALWRTAAMTGMRRGEVLALRWSDVDLNAGQLRVRRALVQVDGVPIMQPPKTEASRRTIDLDNVTVATLRQHRKTQLEERLKWGPTYAEAEQLVFSREDGTAYRPDYIYLQFRRISGRLGLPPIPLHGLRHTHATAMLVANVHPRVVQERLGHASIGTTLEIYSAVIPTMQREAADRVAALVDGAVVALPLTTR